MKNKEGRRTSHSYWSWTHGPRGTTHNSSGKRPWWWRSSRWWFSPPAGCREEFSWCSLSWKRGGGGTEMRSRKRVPVSRVSGHDINICQRGASAEGWGAQAPPPARTGGGPRHQGAWSPGGPPPAVLWLPGSFWNADFLYNFSGIFLAVLVMGKPEIQKQQKTETGTGVH